MVQTKDRVVTPDSLLREVQFLLKTLLREDLFGVDISITEAEKLLDGSLNIAFSEYAAFLKRHGLARIDRERNVIQLRESGRKVAHGAIDPSTEKALIEHFQNKLGRPADRPIALRTAVSAPSPFSSLTASSEIAEAPAFRSDVDADVPQHEERYRKVTRLGDGTLSSVHVVEDRELGRFLVLKEMRHVFDYVRYRSREELMSRMRNATLAQARLSHRGIETILDFSSGQDFPFAVVPYASGGSLRARLLAQPNGCDVEWATRVLLQIMYALREAARHDVVHGNLKPENILFDRQGNVVLSDFGVAHVTEQPAKQSGIPVYVGTATTSYAAPEQLHHGVTSSSSDMFALGVLLYEMLTGRLPGRRSPLPSAVRKEVPPALDDIFDRLAADKAEERYASLDAALDAVYAGLAKEDILKKETVLLFALDDERFQRKPEPDAPAVRVDPLPTADVPQTKDEIST